MDDGPSPAALTAPTALPSHTRGRLFGRNVLEALFRAAPDEDLFLGELLVGVDEVTGRRYLFRVVDVSYGTEHREPGWAERVAGTLLADDARDDTGAHTLHEQAKRTYRLAECRCLGYLAPPSTRAAPGRYSGSPRASRPSSRGSFHRVPRISPSWRGEWVTCPSVTCAAGRLSSSSPWAYPGRAWPAISGSSPPPEWASPTCCRSCAPGQWRPTAATACSCSTLMASTATPWAGHAWAAQALRTYSDRRLPNTSTLRISLAELSVDDLRTAYEWSRPQEEALHELERHYSSAQSRTTGTPGVADGRREGLAWLAEFARTEDIAGFRDVELSARVALYAAGSAPPGAAHRRPALHFPRPCGVRGPPHTRRPPRGQGRPRRRERPGRHRGGPRRLYLTRRVLEEWQSAFLDDPERHRQLPVVAVALEEAQRVLAEQGPRVQRVPPGCQGGPEVRGGPDGGDAAAEAARRRAVEPVQHLLRARSGRRKGPQHPALVRQAGSPALARRYRR